MTGLLCTGDQSLPLDKGTGRETAVENGKVPLPCLLPTDLLAGSLAEVLGRIMQKLPCGDKLSAAAAENVLLQGPVVEGRSFVSCSSKPESCFESGLWLPVKVLYV